MQLILSLAFFAYPIALLCAIVGRRAGLVDHPDHRKRHLGSVPLTGGIAIVLSILVGNFLLGFNQFNVGVLTIIAPLFALAVYDDMGHVHAGLRLVLEFGAGIQLATVGGVAIHNVGNLLGHGDIPLLWLSIPLTALAVAGLTNAYNMIDGIDGLAASLIALPLLVLYILALNAGHPGTDHLLILLVPLGVFLLFNLGPNNRWLPKVFLGDAGSITLGVCVTATLVYFSQGSNPLIQPVTALWLVTVPLMDMLGTMIRRLRAGRSLMDADRDHIHYCLMGMGLNARQTLALLCVHGWGCALTGVLLEAVPAWISLACYFLLFILHCLFVVRSQRIAEWMKARRSEHNHPA
ncbi:MraY family glycosyltransferase [Haliea sp. E17]|uniref:MraY family glycosyltransferase n=1 Tax=Haliea sp. E17 TaxID=3401576 RepID=UPI003AAE29CC